MTSRFDSTQFAGALLAMFIVSCAADPNTRAPAMTPNRSTPLAATLAATRSAVPDRRIEWTSTTYLLHVNGVGGRRTIDARLVRGILSGGLDADAEIYDWCSDIEGLVALGDVQRHESEANKVAQMLVDRARSNPDGRIIVSCHSGGAGIVAWALERLPADVKIDTLLMIQPALSPGFDLSKALAHVSGRAYAFESEHDSIVLGTCTQLMGTMDRVRCDAAGRVGFTMPTSADAGQYRKLRQIPYDPRWTRYDNFGEHIGAMTTAFSKNVIAPLLITGKLSELPTTQPATTTSATKS